MSVGKRLGYVILSLVDALLPPVFIVGIVFLAVLLELWEVLVPYVLALGGLAFVSALLAGVISVHRGGNRFSHRAGIGCSAGHLPESRVLL